MTYGSNIILIGMPGAGKSTIGVVLAKIMQMDFCDTDLIIQKNTGRALQDIIDKDGLDAFLKIENDAIVSLKLQNTIIATGGSVVLSPEAIRHLRTLGVVIYLRADFEQIEKRVQNITTRGIAFEKGQTLHDLYIQRTPIYENSCDFTVDCNNFDCTDICFKIKKNIDTL